MRLRGTKKFIYLTFQCEGAGQVATILPLWPLVQLDSCKEQLRGGPSQAGWRRRRAEKGREGQMLDACQASEASLLSLAGQASAITGAIIFSEKKPLSSLTIRRLQHTEA